MAAGHRPIAIFPGKILETFQDISHLGLTDRIQPVRICRRRREAYGREPDLLRQVFIDPAHMMDAGTQRDSSTDGICLVPPEQHFDPRYDDVVAAFPIGEDTHFVVQFAITVDADGYANPVLSE